MDWDWGLEIGDFIGHRGLGLGIEDWDWGLGIRIGNWDWELGLRIEIGH